MKSRLLLFDIDGTLLDTRGAGASALLAAAVDVLGADPASLPPLDLAGATDGGVIRKLFEDIGHDVEAQLVGKYKESYLRHLENNLNHPSFPGVLLPGVAALLPLLSGHPLGLLTGNLRRGAQLKLERMGIDHHFRDGGFGDDGELRNDLGPVAVRRMAEATGTIFAPEQVIVIGDTPKDVACAVAMGARCLGVETGRFDRQTLLASGAWEVVADLSDTAEIARILNS